MGGEEEGVGVERGRVIVTSQPSTLGHRVHYLYASYKDISAARVRKKSGKVGGLRKPTSGSLRRMKSVQNIFLGLTVCRVVSSLGVVFGFHTLKPFNSQESQKSGLCMEARIGGKERKRLGHTVP